MSIDNCKVSIIVPIFNVEKYLADCLDSVQVQDYKNFEVIGVDDCSSDRSIDIFKRYESDSRFKLRRHKENLGLPSARNTGLLSATGDYVFFLDSDDWIAPHTLSLLIDIANRDDVDIVVGGLTKYDDATGKAFVPKNHAKVMRSIIKNETLSTQSVLFYSVISCNKLIRRSFITENALHFRPVPRRFEDMLTYKWYLEGATVSATPEITYFYRFRSDSDSGPSITQSKDLTVMRDKFLAYADIVQFCKNKGVFNTELDPLNSKVSMMNLRKALVWTSSYVLDSVGNESYDPFERVEALNALRQLFNLLPEYYVNELPPKLIQFCNRLSQFDDIELSVVQ